MAQNDPYYIEQCLNGHPDEFRHLVRRYQTGLLAYLTGKLHNKSSAEKAAQETFVRAYFNLADLKKHDSFYPWLLGIAQRVALEQLRNANQFADVDRMAPQQPEQRKDNYDLEKAIAQLPDSYRKIILLRFYAQQSCSQIAQNLNIPLGTVTKTLSRAYAKLRQLLSDKNELPPMPGKSS